MEKGKLIVIEGTDCSGKETQSNLLEKKLKENGYKVLKMQFPRYDTPTGKIIAGPLLGKKEYSSTYFPGEVSKINPKVASLYYAADRLYNIDEINNHLNSGVNIILDRYVESNMGHQAGKILDDKKREECYRFLETLEYELLQLPRPDLTLFLYMPSSVSKILKAARNEEPDEAEKDEEYIINAEKAYLELEQKNKFKRVECSRNEQPKTVEEISKEVYSIVKEYLDGK